MPFKDKKIAQEYFTNYNHKRAEIVKEAMLALKEKKEREAKIG
jgi:hypothetical protein